MARLNWLRIQRTAPAEIVSSLASLLKGSADPDSALNYFERFNTGAPEKTIDYLARNPAALNALIPLFSQSHFLSETLLLHPEYVEWLHRDKRIEFVKSQEDLLEELSRFEATLGDMELAERLARFKRREYLRIALRDVTKAATLAETAWELSTLADVILEKALRGCDQILRNRYGTPRYVDGAGRLAPSEFVVLALGKLGGNELNYSSDIDLLYLYSEEGETDGIEGRSETQISNQEYFIKLCSAINEAVSRVTPAGWAFRVDLRLRPQGREGFLTRSAKSAMSYYERHAQPWELQALLKARPVAGCLGVGKQFLQSLRARIYPREDKERIIQSIEQMRTKLDHKLQQAPSSGFNIKLERGTIRDIEFITQCLQRVHGAEDFWVHESNTVLALSRLHDNNYLTRPEFVALAGAYEFFRIIEHRLQLDRGQQTHNVPDQPADQQLLALRMGFEDTKSTTAREALLYAIEYHRSAVLRLFHELIEENVGRSIATPRDTSIREREQPRQGTMEKSSLESSLRILDGLQPEFTSIIRHLKLEGSAHSSLVLFLEKLASQPEMLKDLGFGQDSALKLDVLFGSGSILCEAAVRHPEWVMPVLNQLAPAAKQADLRGRINRKQDVITLPQHVGAKKPSRHGFRQNADVNILRSQIRHLIFDCLVEDIMRHPPLAETLRDLTEIAEKAVGDSLSMARDQLRRRFSARMRKVLDNLDFHMAVFGLGRIATNELDVGSDLDLVFACDYSLFKSKDMVREISFRLAETTVSILTSYTREGSLYPVDLRLRPRGKEGELVQDATYLTEYFRGPAQPWEHAAYFKLRPLAGDMKWGQAVLKKLRVGLVAVNQRSLKEDLQEIRRRLEQTTPAPEGALDLKQGIGGVYDIEFALAYRHLMNQRNYPTGSTLFQALQSAGRHGILSDSAVRTFQEAILFYRSLDHALRLWRGGSGRFVDRKVVQDLSPHLFNRMASALSPSSIFAGPLRSKQPDAVMEVCFKIAGLVRREMDRTFET